MRANLFTLCILISIFSTNVDAQVSIGVDNPSTYLMATSEQQKIYLRRYLNVNVDIAAQCQPGWSLDRSNEYFIAWVTDNPQFLRRNLTSAFSAALLHSCNAAAK